ncbi:MAG: helix-turn-helix transcriptional regulator [Planctomycetaceae bacterium]|nr:helix-turn-helix transcriptional regulator [Planctomycetaceae bacterium]
MPRPREGRKPEIEGTPTGLFAANLERLMQKAKLEPDEFAKRIGVSTDAVYKYIRGTNTPDLDRWPDIARVLGLKNARNLLPSMPVE